MSFVKTHKGIKRRQTESPTVEELAGFKNYVAGISRLVSEHLNVENMTTVVVDDEASVMPLFTGEPMLEAWLKQ